MRFSFTPVFFSLLSFLWLGPLPVVAQAPVSYQDKPYQQDYSIKYYLDKPSGDLTGVACDRNGVVQVLSSGGLLQPVNGQFLYPGRLKPDQSHRPMKAMQLKGIGAQNQQLVYLSHQAVLSNAWAGKLYAEHQLPQARFFAATPELSFLVSDGKALHLVRDSKLVWKGALPSDEVISIRFQSETNVFWVLGKTSVYTLSSTDFTLTKGFDGSGFTAFDLTNSGKQIIIGTTDGYIELDAISKKQIGAIQRKLPWTDITSVKDIAGRVWFGTTQGAFARRPDGQFDYYYGERWLPDNQVVDIVEGPQNSVLILTTAGLSQICFKSMTLHDKALFYEDQVRQRHIRNGFNASLDGLKQGDIATGYLADSDNDGLWTSMYLAGEVFRYTVTKDKVALQNCRESLEAMERLYTINPVPGFPARSFERAGLIEQLADPDRWQHSPQPGWDWKSTTSSDEVIGHIFAFSVMAELMDDKNLKSRSITLIDTVMSHILSHDLYLIDFDGKPTMWGKWNPAYVNNFPLNVGDRKLNSSNIIAMLQTAYRFTRKEKYKAKALELMQKYGYLENLTRPMSVIGQAPDNADTHSKKMSDAWNHSDDEMYFLGYWGLYRYAFDDALKAKYRQAILDHWQIERPEKDGAWNIMTAITGKKDIDLPEAIWFLQEHPLDLIDWETKNSHRKDIYTLAPNFRQQTTKVVLPPDERPIQRHNGNTFLLDSTHGNGLSEYSAGDIWLLPYWMGRYMGVINAPRTNR